MIEILLSIASMIMSGFAIVLLKIGLNSISKRKRTPFSYLGALFTKKVWLIGTALMLGGSICRFISVSIADLSFVRFIFVNHLLIVIVCSRILAGEIISKSLMVSVSVLLSGLCFVAVSPPLTRSGGSDAWSFLVFFVVILLGFLLSLVITISNSKFKNIFFGISSACSFGLGALIQGYIAAYMFDVSLIFDVDFILSIIFNPFVYLIVIFSFSGFVLSNVVMSKFKISLVYPICYPVSEIIVLIGSIVVFNEDVSFETNTLRAVGILLIIAGLIHALITQRHFLSGTLREQVH